MPEPALTQQELARRLGVTQMTVSRALSGKGRMTPATRERVLAMAAELGYRPNGLARRVHEGRYRGMAMVGSSVRPSYNMQDQELWMAVSAALVGQGWHLTATYMDHRDLAEPERLRGLLEALLADAVLIHDVGPQAPSTGEMLARHRVPAVWINSGREADAADFDDAGGARALTAHLLASGHRRPALLLPGDPDEADQHHSLPRRRDGFRAACQEAGVPARVCFPPDPPPRPRDLHYRFARDLLAGPDRPDALVCYAPMAAYHARLAAAEAGLRVPEDVGLATFGKPGDAFLDQPMTVGVLDYALLGREAVRLAQTKLADPAAILAPVLVPVPVLMRTTTRGA